MAERQDLADGRRNAGPLRDGDRITGPPESGAGNAYTLRIDEPSNVSLALRSSAFDTVLHVTGEGSELVDDDGGSGTDSRLQTVLMPGEYRLDVESYSGTGAYRLCTEQRAFEGCISNGGEVATGEEVYGQLSPGRSLTYRLVVEAAQEVIIETTSGAVDTILGLTGNGVSEQNDDAGDLG